MRLFLILLLAPAWAFAQPVAINPASIAGYIRADLGGGPEAENVLLVYDNEGVIDLYIFARSLNSGAFRAPEIYVPYFEASTRTPPTLRLLPDKSFTVLVNQSSGIGAYARATRIAYRNGAFRIIGILNEFYPNTGEGVRRCAYDLEQGVASFTALSGKVLEISTEVQPLELDGQLPATLTQFCED
jgi:hypothetical protein